jgi:phage terminase small subunit
VSEGLTDKQQLFVEHYLACLNATEAAARAGYQGKRNILAVTGHENLRNPKIRAAIDARMAELVMPADEVLFRLSEQASGSMADFMSLKGRGVGLDLKKATLADKLHLVKKYSKTKQGVSIELYDAHAAQSLLGKHHGLFVERHEHSWKDALKQQGHDPDAIKQQLVAAAIAALTSTDRSADERGNDGSSAADSG